MGTPAFAVPTLALLLDRGHEIAAVVTVPDKPAGRGRRLTSSAVKTFAGGKELPLLMPQSVKDAAFAAAVRDLRPDLIVVVAFRILPPAVFLLPRLGAINLHASLLPKYRGAAPINRAIMNGERETGVTTFFLREAVDTGSIVLQARVPIGPDETAGELAGRLAEVGAEIVCHTVGLIALGKAVPRLQDEAAATPAPKIVPAECRIDWSRPAHEIHDFVRGLSPRPGAFTGAGGRTIKIYRTFLGNCPPGAHAEGDPPGTARTAAERLFVRAGAGSAIEIVEVQQEGKRPMTAAEFVRGRGISPGERLG